ncbi:MAG: dodecin domain-containing protein [Betaproteobacteria bacterium]|nr:dodecin domain-containing protein [Betaproteobacteria bacterium]MBK9606876.1 dodecin domain-containing protein [Betaproteobacteria bacterium]
MTVARISEISSVSSKSFEDAIVQGIERANKTLKNVKGAWVKDQEVIIENGKVSGYKVILKVTFVLTD